jgi:hypothetical protein
MVVFAGTPKMAGKARSSSENLERHNFGDRFGTLRVAARESDFRSVTSVSRATTVYV